ncbi:MAG: hypothetical protein MI741_21740, partial [Rhodospirillales bacterium]|nr:hypothetical protein [Rhodospirillales bacterium]
MKHGSYNILIGDCREKLAELPDQHFHCCVTSPPYYGLRDYGVVGQIGLEPTPDDFVAAMLAVFGGRDNPVGVWRVLRDDGCLWINIGDSYASAPKNRTPEQATANSTLTGSQQTQGGVLTQPNKVVAGLKPKDLIGIPWRIAFTLRDAGWYLRDAIVWQKLSPMPGSQKDRCTSSYEYIFQLAKQRIYHFDLEAIKEPAQNWGTRDRKGQAAYTDGVTPQRKGHTGCLDADFSQRGRTPRNVWRIAHEGFDGGHFAVFPREIPLRCIKASTSERGCCLSCGAPWKRMLDKVRRPTRPGETTKVKVPSGWDTKLRSHGTIHQEGRTQETEYRETAEVGNRDPQRHVTETRTVGWQPGCDCIMPAGNMPLPPVPCRVLDPFG